MKEGQSLWTKEESILAINLYCKIPFGQMHSRNKDVIELAILIDRSPSAVARKLGNFASLDPKLRERGVKGLENISKLDAQVWHEFMQNWDEEFIEGEKLLAKKKHTTIEQLNNIDLDNLKDVEGKERERLVRVRVNQSLFRKIVLTNFNNQCCITGIDVPELIVASHILPWSKDKGNRLNPKNGLALNTLHDKAFDCGLITITEELKIKISSRFYKAKNVESIQQNFIAYDGQLLIEPKKFTPGLDFLKAHNEFFKG
ncbi:HNH endonuclease [Mucilaginibacter corticis]|uniref:HNH endonuclease n=1 Tax=Mucilaginibacter corticis TaxID=2597670 RepID=A0A556MUU3_9SPHI|nr:HNH endonuclease [Mucilaginibacter corticis]TSJ43588.1 HNH endonuclease [Mucilaginibacter corticis]